jgi:hypothetical protein
VPLFPRELLGYHHRGTKRTVPFVPLGWGWEILVKKSVTLRAEKLRKNEYNLDSLAHFMLADV